ncbi:ABC transporter permease [Paenibacillus sp. ACRRX]|uniref:ABC transporter permease n=1 Tax=Paenibacillus sp. ACRRX TaxID=2918206 RepID=UPI001EF42417|nr:ABC transporter permease [Paenibacillus sp. ACRRX]MCG7409762.1 ABC transporter permease [Paenibacillus sp. ACRRX]
MRTLHRILYAEILKLKRSKLALILILSPLMAAMLGLMYSLNVDQPFAWKILLSQMAMAHAVLFLPLLSGVLSAFICRYEHANGGWKQLLSLPVSRSGVYISKYVIVAVLLGVTQLIFLGAVLLVGSLKGIAEPIPWIMLCNSVLNGWIASLPLIALQMLMAMAWASFAAPLAVNVIFTLPNLMVIQSKYGIYYPWGQPSLAMLPQNDSFGINVSLETLLFVIGGSFVLFVLAGLSYINRKEI